MLLESTSNLLTLDRGGNKFVWDNHCDYSYFKITTKGSYYKCLATGPISNPPIAPTLADMIATTTNKVEFRSYLIQGNGILRQHPNHWLINPDIVVLADGATSIKSKDAGGSRRDRRGTSDRQVLNWQEALRTS
jgi:hypothetical protein